MGKLSVHLLGSERKFEKVHGIDLCAIAVDRLNKFRLATDCEAVAAHQSGRDETR